MRGILLQYNGTVSLSIVIRYSTKSYLEGFGMGGICLIPEEVRSRNGRTFNDSTSTSQILGVPRISLRHRFDRPPIRHTARGISHAMKSVHAWLLFVHQVPVSTVFIKAVPVDAPVLRIPQT